MACARTKARKRALDILYEAELRGEPVLDLLAERTAAADPPVPEYAAVLVRGVQEHAEQIDQLLAAHAHGWTLDRMPAVDRNILRIGVHEMLWNDDVPDAVAISEAVLLAGRTVHRRLIVIRQWPAGPAAGTEADAVALKLSCHWRPEVSAAGATVGAEDVVAAAGR